MTSQTGPDLPEDLSHHTYSSFGTDVVFDILFNFDQIPVNRAQCFLYNLLLSILSKNPCSIEKKRFASPFDDLFFETINLALINCPVYTPSTSFSSKRLLIFLDIPEVFLQLPVLILSVYKLAEQLPQSCKSYTFFQTSSLVLVHTERSVSFAIRWVNSEY